MPKTISIDPDITRRPETLEFPNIPVHAYDTLLAVERQRMGDDRLINVLRHMKIIRAFESMLASLKSSGKYENITYNYKGPAHLSVGQEAAAVGAAMAMHPTDHIFGSHRSHGEFLAKGLAAISSLEDADLQTIMAAHQQGKLLATVQENLPDKTLRERAENFLIFGLLAEIFMKSNGFNGGMGGSMHAFFPPFGAYPNNAIVGASAGIATGAALRKKLANSDSIAVSMSGDGSTGCGPVWEAMNFSSMAQYETLWTDVKKGGLPILFLFMNNFYAMGGQTKGETMGWDRLSRIGAGLNPDAMHAETVDGNNPLAVADAVRRKRALLIEGRGPALLDIECYRASGHSSSDTNIYRSKEEMAAWDNIDPIKSFGDRLIAEKIIDAAQITSLQGAIDRQMQAIVAAAIDPNISPAVDIESDPTLIGNLMFSNQTIEVPNGTGETLVPLDKIVRVRQNAKKNRFGLDLDGTPISPMRAITLRDGLFEPILHHMIHDERLIAYGEECREWGGAFGVYRGLSDAFPHQRIFNSPISEAAIVATGVGYALEGGRALIELMYGDFIGRAGDEIFNQMAKWHAMSNGALKLPLVLRCSVGSKYGAQHSQDWSALVAHVPGLKVVYPATPYDAKGLMASALSSEDPVVFFESQRLYDKVEQFQADGVPEGYYRIPFGSPDVKRRGEDVTVLTIGPSLYSAIEAADELEQTHNLSVEIIDARSLVPFDYAPVLKSVKKTGRLVLVSESSERGSFAMTIATNVTRFGFSDLKAPPRVIGTPNWIVPGADMEASYFPQAHDITDIITSEMFPDIRRNRKGVRSWDDQELAKLGL